MIIPRNCPAKDMDTALESTLVEVEEKENNARLSLLPACPLPSAVYKTSSALEEAEAEAGPGQDYEYITEAYGAVSSEATVTKHLARVKVPTNYNGLTWNEDCLVNFYSNLLSVLF